MEIVGDFSTSVRAALKEIDRAFIRLPGLVVCGTHDPKDIDKTVFKLHDARKMGTPTLGICMGMQLMAIEYARNILGYEFANTMEVDPNTPTPIIVKLPALRVGIVGTTESHWHNYRFNEDYMSAFHNDWTFSLVGNVVETMRLKDHPHYVGVQFHPEYNSFKGNFHPVLTDFLTACKYGKRHYS